VGLTGLVRPGALAAMATAAALAACTPSARVVGDPEARAQFPDLTRLYGGDQGLYRGCGPNGGVCHNGNEFPNLDSIGSILDSIGRDCNQKRDTAEALHDMCERRGDLVEISGEPIELAYVVPVAGSGEPPRAWTLGLRAAPAAFAAGERLRITRGAAELVHLGDFAIASELDPADPTRRTVRLVLPPAPAPAPSAPDPGADLARQLARAGIPGAADTLRVGDPNRNGVFGADLGAKLVRPGDPQRSYLLRRLLDPAAGPLMPRANCCAWTRPALRALWCWVAGLAPDGANALAPINYDTCPPSPPVELGYPDLGEGCESSGMCPPVAVGGTGEPRFPSIYAEILAPRCGGDGCHDRTPFGGGVDLRDEAVAFVTLAAKLVPGQPEASTLVRRLDPDLCRTPCATMPLGRPPLTADELARIRQWITDGAERE
jgi:hypothetical protein